MEGRKKLKNIANGLLSSFLSRNNDVYGYWGIGKLLSFMVSKKKNLIIIDLLNERIEPKEKEFSLLIKEYKEKLIFKLMKSKLDITLLKKVQILIHSEFNVGSILNVMNFQFIIQDLNNNEISLKKSIKCRKHNPMMEMKSTRNYGNK